VVTGGGYGGGYGGGKIMIKVLIIMTSKIEHTCIFKWQQYSLDNRHN